MKIKPIETKYKGYRFRSRLEARWAVFFETLGCSWEYEPEGFDLNGLYYLPDFKVKYPGGDSYWFEVKSSVKNLTDEDVKKMTLFARHVDTIYLLDGTPEFGSYFWFSNNLEGLTHDAWSDYSREVYDSIQDDISNVYNYAKAIGKANERSIKQLKLQSDTSIISMNANTVKGNSRDIINEPTQRWGDVLYTHEDGGRIWGGEYGGNVDSYWHPLLTQAVTAARSARFEHGENPGRYDNEFKGGSILETLKRAKEGGVLQ